MIDPAFDRALRPITTQDQYFGWVAVFRDEYDGPGSLIGIGFTEEAAIAHLIEQDERSNDR